MFLSLVIHCNFNIIKSLEGQRVQRVRMFSNNIFGGHLKLALGRVGLFTSGSQPSHHLGTFNKTLLSNEKFCFHFHLSYINFKSPVYVEKPV